METDPVVAEVRAVREQLAARLGFRLPISSKKHSGKILLATEKSSGSHHDAQSPRP